MKKAQAAMEYLLTYGLAILAVVLIISALIYFDVLNPKQFLPKRCQLQDPLQCAGAQVKSDGTINIAAINGQSGRIEVTDGEATIEETDETVSLTNILGDRVVNSCGQNGGPNHQFTIGEDFVASGLDNYVGEKVTLNVEISYIDADTGFTHDAKGKIVATVE
jgi:hypothetical protein